VCVCDCGVQVHSLLNVVRPDRQTLLFSATLPRKIEALVAEALSNPVRISVGLLGAANADIQQRVEIMKGEDQAPSIAVHA
jgi:ATP-dependent RNA helicase DDX42